MVYLINIFLITGDSGNISILRAIFLWIDLITAHPSVLPSSLYHNYNNITTVFVHDNFSRPKCISSDYEIESTMEDLIHISQDVPFPVYQGELIGTPIFEANKRFLSLDPKPVSLKSGLALQKIRKSLAYFASILFLKFFRRVCDHIIIKSPIECFP